MNKVFIKKYIQELEGALTIYGFSRGTDYEAIYRILRKCIKVIGQELNIDESMFGWKAEMASEDAEIMLDILKYNLSEKQIYNKANDNSNELGIKEPIIFISHKSDDKKYGDAIRNFIVGLGVKNEQLIYTSHELHKIPLDANIFEYLRKNIHSNVFMIILWSNEYLDSPACLNEMGAAWIFQSDYTNIYTPKFSFGNPKYHECVVDTSKMGAVLNGDRHCKTSMIELKDKVEGLFGLKNDEKTINYLLDQFVEEISDDYHRGIIKDSNVVEF